jgi:FkbM family methyltransferase
MTAVDIGANFGYHTFRMARAVGSEGKVIAMEPTGWAFSKLQRNMALNSADNIHPVKSRARRLRPSARLNCASDPVSV